VKLLELESAVERGLAIRRAAWHKDKTIVNRNGLMIHNVGNGEVQLTAADLFADDWTRADGCGRDTADRNDQLVATYRALGSAIADAMTSPGITKRVEVDASVDFPIAKKCLPFLGLFFGLDMCVAYGPHGTTFEIAWNGETPSSNDTRNTPPVLARRVPDKRNETASQQEVGA